jgi:hypothetical protein
MPAVSPTIFAAVSGHHPQITSNDGARCSTSIVISDCSGSSNVVAPRCSGDVAVGCGGGVVRLLSAGVVPGWVPAGIAT